MRLTASLLVGIFCASVIASSARAELMPDEALQKDYDNCMGGKTAEEEPEHAQYCDCVRDGMRKWSVDDYGAVATEAKTSQATPDKIADLAKGCISQILH